MTYGFNSYSYGNQMQNLLNQQAQAQNQANHSLLGQTTGYGMMQKTTASDGGITHKLQGLSSGQIPLGGAAGFAGNQLIKLFGGLFGG